MPRCPECYRPVDILPIQAIVQPKAVGLIGRGFGVACPHCLTRLVIDQRIAWVASAVIYLGAFAAALFYNVQIGRFVQESLWPNAIIVAAAIVVLVVTQRLSIPYLIALRRVGPEERVNFPLEWDTKPISPIDLSSDRKGGASPNTWKCHACGERNPETFDVCWKCGGTPRSRGA